MMSSSESFKATDEPFAKFMAWADANRPEERKQWWSPGAYDLVGRSLGELETRLCKAYQEAIK